MDDLVELLSESERTLVITHTHADLDTIGSAVGVATTLPHPVEIATPNGVQAEARRLLEGYPAVEDPDLSSYDLHVVVDAPSEQRIEPLSPDAEQTPFVVIDHHEPADLRRNSTASLVDTSSPATALLVTELLDRGGWELQPEAAVALAAGALDDTGFRAVIMEDARERTLELLERAGPANEILARLWHDETSWGERMATAKAVVRANGYKARETIVLVSQVGGEETAAAHALLDGNADIAIVLSDRGSQTRVVARTASSMDGELALPDDILTPLADQFGGYGGGHAGAGIAKLESADPEAVERLAVECVEEALGMQFGSFS